jgi:predicted membrane metal-binding protein
MNIKRIFGSVLTVLGIIGLIYTAVIFVNTGGGVRDIRALVVYGLLVLSSSYRASASSGLLRMSPDV